MYTSPDDLLLSNLDNTLGGVEKRAGVLFFGKIIRVPLFYTCRMFQSFTRRSNNMIVYYMQTFALIKATNIVLLLNDTTVEVGGGSGGDIQKKCMPSDLQGQVQKVV